MHLALRPRLGSVGVMVNTGGGTLVDMSAADAAAFWARPTPGMMPIPGIVNPDGSVGASGGWTSMPGFTQASLAPQPPVPPPTQGYMSLAPGMGQPVWNQTLSEYLAGRVQATGTICLSQPTNPDCVGGVADMANQAIDFCHVHPDSPGCGNPAGTAASFAAQLADYKARLAAYNANPSSQTGIPVYLNPGGGGPMMGGGSPGGSAFGGNALNNSAPVNTYVPTSQMQNNPLAPPMQNPALPSGSLVRNTGASGDMTGNNGGGGGESDITAWLKDNWILIAAGVGAVVLLPAIISASKG